MNERIKHLRNTALIPLLLMIFALSLYKQQAYESEKFSLFETSMIANNLFSKKLEYLDFEENKVTLDNIVKKTKAVAIKQFSSNNHNDYISLLKNYPTTEEEKNKIFKKLLSIIKTIGHNYVSFKIDNVIFFDLYFSDKAYTEIEIIYDDNNKKRKSYNSIVPIVVDGLLVNPRLVLIGLKDTHIKSSIKPYSMAKKILKRCSVSFKLTEHFFKEIQNQNVPSDIINALQQLKNKEYDTESKLIAELKQTIGKPQTDKFESLILEHAKFSDVDVIIYDPFNGETTSLDVAISMIHIAKLLYSEMTDKNFSDGYFLAAMNRDEKRINLPVLQSRAPLLHSSLLLYLLSVAYMVYFSSSARLITSEDILHTTEPCLLIDWAKKGEYLIIDKVSRIIELGGATFGYFIVTLSPLITGGIVYILIKSSSTPTPYWAAFFFFSVIACICSLSSAHSLIVIIGFVYRYILHKNSPETMRTGLQTRSDIEIQLPGNTR